MAHLKGQNVNLLIKSGNAYSVIAASTSCDMNVTANTTDAAAKDDPGYGMFDNPEFTNYSWTASNESFIVDINFLYLLLDKVINGDATFDIQYQVEGNYGNSLSQQGKAVVSSLTVDAANGDFVKVSMSLDGNGALTNAPQVTVAPAASVLPRIKGKALMVAIKNAAGNWATIACASSHKLTVNCNLSEITDKDYNDKAVLREVTGKSVSLSTENLIEAIISPGQQTGHSMNELFDAVTNGTTLTMAFGYYPSSIGASIHGDATKKMTGWGEPETTLLQGQFLCSSFASNGANKSDATFSAEFQNKGAVTVTAPSAAALAEE